MRVQHRVSAIVAAAALLGLPGVPAEDPQPAAGQGWQLVWDDEFDGDAVDTSKWEFATDCWGGGNSESECYTDRTVNAFVSDGKLVIQALKESFTGPAVPPDWGTDLGDKTLPYTSARLRTKGKGDWTYGRFEIRAKLPAGQGLWPAIWMLPTEDDYYGTWPAGGEIDIMEAINLRQGGGQQVYGTLHYGSQAVGLHSSGTGYSAPDFDPSGEFHTYALEWSAHEIRWYVDGAQYQTQRSDGWFTTTLDDSGDEVAVGHGAPFDRDFHLLLNLAVGGTWPGEPNASTVFPAQMQVDFVRVWTCPAAPETLEGCETVGDDAEVVSGSVPPGVQPQDPGTSAGDVGGAIGRTGRLYYLNAWPMRVV